MINQSERLEAAGEERRGEATMNEPGCR